MQNYIYETDRLKGQGNADYIRDIWCLGPASNNYPGSFPRGYIKKLETYNIWGKNRLWLFSGSFKDPGGVTVDIEPSVNPDYCLNCEQLPFENECFDFVNLDPPYSKEESERLYNKKHFSIVKTLNEAARVCKLGGYVVLLHRLLPWIHPNENEHKKRLKIIAVIGVFTIAGYSNMRALTIWQKQ